MLSDALTGLGMVFRFDVLGMCSLGVILGIIVGSIPGLTATMAIAILLPFSFFLSPIIGISFLVAITKGAMFGGSISAILINTPGTGAAVATTFDGYPMARQGKARKALEMALYSSVSGDFIGSIVTLFGISILAYLALLVGPPELTTLILMSFMMIAILSGKSQIKGLISAFLGFWLSTIGLDPLTGAPRYTIGIPDLAGGLSIISVVIGLFAVAEVLRGSEKRITSKDLDNMISKSLKKKEEGLTFKEFRKCGKTIIRSSIVGIFIGIIPGIDQVVAAFVAYGVAKGASKDPERFGKGALEGIAAPEAANNASNCPIFMPLLTLGIPGGVVAAIVLGAFLVHGIRPGPNLLTTQGPIVYSILWAFLFSNFLVLIYGFISLRFFALIARFPTQILLPIVASLCFVGSYCVNNSLFDILIAVIFGGIGYLMYAFDIPITPLVITLILGPLFETALGQSLIMGGSSIIFFKRPIALLFLILTPIVLIYLLKRLPKEGG